MKKNSIRLATVAGFIPLTVTTPAQGPQVPRVEKVSIVELHKGGATPQTAGSAQ